MSPFVVLLLALAAVSLGLRTTAILIPRIHPGVRLVASIAVGTIFVIVTLQIGEQYAAYDLGLGMLVSLSPVGIYDLAKWWIRRGQPSESTAR